MEQVTESVDTLNLRLKYVQQCQIAEEKKPSNECSSTQLATIIFSKAMLQLQKADLLFDQGQFDEARKCYKLTVKNLEDVIKYKTAGQKSDKAPNVLPRKLSSFINGFTSRTLCEELKKNTPQSPLTDELMYLHKLKDSVLFHNVSKYFDEAMAANQERGIDRVDLKHRRADSKAMRAGVNGRYHKHAIILYNQILDELDDQSKSVPALYSKGLSLYRLGQYEPKCQYEDNTTPSLYTSARECFQHVFDINKNHVHTINGLGNLELISKDPQLALELFIRANTVDNQYAPALYNQGKCLQLLGSYQKAINQFMNSVDANHSNNTIIIRSAQKLAAELNEELTQWREIGVTTDSHQARNAVHELLNIKVSMRLRRQVIGQVEHLELSPDGDGGYERYEVIDNPIGHAMKKSGRTLRDMFIMLTKDMDSKDRGNGNTYVIRFMKLLGITNRHDYYKAFNKLIEQCESGDAGYILGIVKKVKPVKDVCGHDYLKRPTMTCEQPDLIKFNIDFESVEFSSTVAREYVDDSELSDDSTPDDATTSSLSVSSPVSVKSSSFIYKLLKRDPVDGNDHTTLEDSEGYKEQTMQEPVILLDHMRPSQNHSVQVASEMYSNALYYLQIEQPKIAVQYLKSAAFNNHPAAQFEFGRCYELGLGIEQNKQQALKWYQRAEQHGFSWENMSSTTIEHGQDEDQNTLLPRVIEKDESVPHYHDFQFMGQDKFSMPRSIIDKKLEVIFSIDRLKLNPDYDHPLGSGGFCVVYPGEYENMPIAIKALNVEKIQSSIRQMYFTEEDRTRELRSMINDFRQEANRMLYLNHRNIIRTYGFVDDLTSVLIVMAKMEGGSLQQKISHGMQRLPIENLRIALEISAGLNYLHNQGILHNDMKADNVLFSADNTPVICDFGLSSDIREQVCGGGTLNWNGPECFEGAQKQPRSIQSDIWSLALVIWSLYANETPFTAERMDDIPRLIVKERIQPSIPMSVPEKLKNMLLQCWSYNPVDRPASVAIILGTLKGLKQTDSTDSFDRSSYGTNVTYATNTSVSQVAARTSSPLYHNPSDNMDEEDLAYHEHNSESSHTSDASQREERAYLEALIEVDVDMDNAEDSYDDDSREYFQMGGKK